MEKHSYSLHINNEKTKEISGHLYSERDLQELTTYQLREICTKEKIIKGITNPLNRYELVETILRYRGLKRSKLITKFCENGMERIEILFARKKGTKLKDEGCIKNPAKMVIYEGLALTLFDKYKVDIIRSEKQFHLKSPVASLEECNVLLVGEDKTLCGIFNLCSDGQEQESYFLTKDAEQKIKLTNNKLYSLWFFTREESDYIYNEYYGIPNKHTMVLNYFDVPLVDLEICPVETTNTILAIDFGTSNTAAGAYLDYGYVNKVNQNDILNGLIKTNEVNIIPFLDVTDSKKKWTPLLPTVVSVLDCSNPEHVIYQFGYDALNEKKVKYYDENFSIFYEIKRWVNTYNQMQEIVDKAGNIAYVKRYEIIKAYFQYVIQNAQQRFKCKFKKLHITCPVKQKYQYLKMFEELLGEYELNTKKMLDEGTAVVYNTISNLMKKKHYYDGEWIKSLIIDCGGGTTDLSSCSFMIENNPVAYQVKIVTTYENGDTNFGGNNITYRIMQFIKIIFAMHYTHQMIPQIDEIISVSSEDMFRFVDEYGVDKVYENLERLYEEAEKIIPTKFKNYENHTRDEYFMVKNNFYFLFEIADKMKKKFYMRDGVIRNRFQSTYEEEEGDLKVTRIDRWNLVVYEQGKLRYNHNFPEVIFNIKEIELLLKADIYAVVNKFLNEFYEENLLGEYSIIKLTGQSCRIDIFKEALKEFIPGKSIEFKQYGKDEASILDLKLACVKGAIQYVNAQKIGFTEVSLSYERPMIPYSISGYTHESEEKILIDSLDRMQTHGYLSRNREISHLELLLKDGSGKLKYRYHSMLNVEDFQPVLYEEIVAKYSEYQECILQEDTDDITDGEVKFFVFASKDNWGFYVVPITRTGTQLYLGQDTYYAFENDAWELDFFDGTK